MAPQAAPTGSRHIWVTLGPPAGRSNSPQTAKPSSSYRGELTGLDELEERRDALGVDPLQRRGQQPDPEAAAALVRIGPQEAEVVVRFDRGMGGLEALEGLHHPGRSIPEQLRQEALQALIIDRPQLRLPRRDPERHRRAIPGEPGRFVAESRLRHQPPDGPVLSEPPLGVRERPAPNRIGVERPRQNVDRGGDLGGRCHPRFQWRVAVRRLRHFF